MFITPACVFSFCSARPSKLRARLAIAGIWCLACGLAAPMAVALRVTNVDETDPSKFQYRCGNLLFYFPKQFYENVIVTVGTFSSESFLSELWCRYQGLICRLNPCFCFTCGRAVRQSRGSAVTNRPVMPDTVDNKSVEVGNCESTSTLQQKSHMAYPWVENGQ